MSANHPLIGHAVRVSPGLPPRIVDRSFDGIVVDVSPVGLLVMRLDDGTVKAWGPEAVRFTDPERAARVLRAHAATTEAQGLGFMVVFEYTPPRWVPAADVAVGTPILAAVHPDGQMLAQMDSGVTLTASDSEAFASMGMLLLVGEWPPLPKEGA